MHGFVEGGKSAAIQSARRNLSARIRVFVITLPFVNPLFLLPLLLTPYKGMTVISITQPESRTCAAEFSLGQVLHEERHVRSTI
jgi:hypothetical protein